MKCKSVYTRQNQVGQPMVQATYGTCSPAASQLVGVLFFYSLRGFMNIAPLCTVVISRNTTPDSTLPPTGIAVFKRTDWVCSQPIKMSDGHTPDQIFVMKSKELLLVKDGDCSFNVIDKHGTIMCHMTKGAGTHAFPALCKDDSIIVAWVRHTAGLVTIDKYTSEFKHVATLIVNHKIVKSSTRCWYYLQEFTTGELALCTTDRLYIFRNP